MFNTPGPGLCIAGVRCLHQKLNYTPVLPWHREILWLLVHHPRTTFWGFSLSRAYMTSLWLPLPATHHCPWKLISCVEMTRAAGTKAVFFSCSVTFNICFIWVSPPKTWNSSKSVSIIRRKKYKRMKPVVLASKYWQTPQAQFSPTQASRNVKTI